MLPPKRVTSYLVSRANPLLSLVHKCIPNRLEHFAILKLMNTLTKDFLEHGELDFMQGKIANIVIEGVGINWFFTLSEHHNHDNEHLLMLDKPDLQADVVFSGTLESMVLMASQKVDPDTLFFKRQLSITGDTELGLEIKNLIDQFDINLLQKPVKKALDIWSDTLLESQYA